MIEKLTKAEADDLNELKSNPAFKLFRAKIVEPYVEQCQRYLCNITPATKDDGPILAAEIRMLRKIFDDLADAIDVK